MGTDNTVPMIEYFARIPAADGRVLSARLWRPRAAGCYPAILEFSPYRVWDLFRGFGEVTLPYWAARGYAAIAVDIAGSGASTGMLYDEYLSSEIDDACTVIDWCARQNWCDGNVGLSGLSWAAFTALRVSDRKPFALKAMVLGAVSEDGWQTDVHYLGGVPYTAQIDWAGAMLMFNALPPDPDQFGQGWRAEWKKRLEINRPWIESWLAHPRHDDYWKRKAAKFDSEVPLLIYSGLADKYATSVLRIAEQWRGPVRTIIGPWDHSLPNLSSREPRIGILQEALRWWDRWLKGRETGAMDEAPLRLWVGAPDKGGDTREGNWRALASQSARTLALRVADSQLVTGDTASNDAGWTPLRDLSPLPEALGIDLYEDVPAPFEIGAFARANAVLAFAPPQTEDIDIVGVPVLRCTVRASERGRPIIARLIDQGPSGASIRMTTGALATGPGEDTDVTIPFQTCGWRLKKGRALALVLHASGAPTFWDGPFGSTTHVKDIRLSLPVLTATRCDEVSFPAPVAATTMPTEKLKWIDRAKETIAFPPREHTASRETASAAYHLPATGTDYFITSRFEVRRDWAAKSYRIAFERPGYSIRIDVRLEVSSTPEAFHIAWTVSASENGAPFHDARDKATVNRLVV